MSTRRFSRPQRIDQDTAERLLGGLPATLQEAGPLAVPLAAARAPAMAQELAGEQTALAAFQAAAHLDDPVPQPRRPSMLKTTLAKLLTVKAAAVAALGVGGVALAASTGVVPTPLGSTPTTPPASHAPAAPTTTPSHPAAGGSSHAAPSPSLRGLCKAYAKVAANPGKTLSNPAFTALINAAGGAKHVNAYCATLTPNSAASSHPGADRTGHPTRVPHAPAADAPTSHPDSPAKPHPADAPTSAPSDPAVPRPGH